MSPPPRLPNVPPRSPPPRLPTPLPRLPPVLEVKRPCGRAEAVLRRRVREILKCIFDVRYKWNEARVCSWRVV